MAWWYIHSGCSIQSTNIYAQTPGDTQKTARDKAPVLMNFTFYWGREKQKSRVNSGTVRVEVKVTFNPTVIQRDHSYRTLVELARCHKQERKTPRKKA